jgi:hypothetical protein
VSPAAAAAGRRHRPAAAGAGSPAAGTARRRASRRGPVAAINTLWLMVRRMGATNTQCHYSLLPNLGVECIAGRAALRNMDRSWRSPRALGGSDQIRSDQIRPDPWTRVARGMPSRHSPFAAAGSARARSSPPRPATATRQIISCVSELLNSGACPRPTTIPPPPPPPPPPPHVCNSLRRLYYSCCSLQLLPGRRAADGDALAGRLSMACRPQ